MGAAPALAVGNVDTVNIDLAPLIDRAAGVPERYAVDVPHRVSSARDGVWTRSGPRDTWELTVRVPTAVSLSFHASKILLPSSAVLTLGAAGVTYQYKPAQIHGVELWSRLGRGDTLDIRITVDHTQRQQTLLEIASFQAGYRSLEPGFPDNPHYAKLRQQLQPMAGGCVENYECHVGTGVDNSAQATAALVIANQIECTGTLVNDVPNDGTPYILTARHCEMGNWGGADPAAASSVTVYWDATTPCGQSLQSIFSASTTLGYGQATVFEQQDVWLIRLSTIPPADAYMSGWDATGAPVVGGFTIHDAQADTKQYVAWTGTAALETLPPGSLGASFGVSFLDVVNAVGSVDLGASGSGLFTSSGQLVGSLSLGANSCPVSPPPQPGPTTAVAKFSALAEVWTSTADTTSSTGSTTLASILDPQNTGTTFLEGSAPPVHVVLQTSGSTLATGAILNIYWSSTGQACTASGGNAGDGWTGALPALGTVQVNETNVGAVTYDITCTGTGPPGHASATVNWSLGSASVRLNSDAAQYIGQTFSLQWSTANVSDCTASGGAPGDGWGGAVAVNGSQQLMETAPGLYTYTLTCMDNGQPYSSSAIQILTTPFADLTVDQGPTTMRVGQPIQLDWRGTTPCVGSGGAPGDGWASSVASATYNFDYGNTVVTTSTPGTYTYILTCGPGSLPATASVTVTFTSAAPSATLTADPTTAQTIVGTASISPNLTWIANVTPCTVTYAGPEAGTVVSGAAASGSIADVRSLPGTYTYTVSCGSDADEAQGTAQIVWTQPTPSVALTVPTYPHVAGQGVPLTVSSNVVPCIASGGAPGDGWTGTLSFPANSTYTIVEPSAGAYTYSVTCGVGPYGTAQASVVFDNPGGAVLTMTAAGGSSPFVGESDTISWSSQVGPCTEYGGGQNDGWGGSQLDIGSTSVAYDSPVPETYTMVCGSGAQQVAAQLTLSWQPTPEPDVQFTWDQSHDPVIGMPLTLNWTGISEATCTATEGVSGDGWAGSRPANGSYAVTETQLGAVFYSMNCALGNVQGGGLALVNWVPVSPTVTLSAFPEQTSVGLPVQLTWTTQNATSCSASTAGANSSSSWGSSPSVYSTSGSQTLTESVPGTYQYVLSCMDYDSFDYTRTPEVTVTATVTYTNPTVSLSASSQTVVAGSSVQLNWTSTNAQSCSAAESAPPSVATNNWSGPMPPTGSQTITTPAAGSYTFTLECSAGTVTASSTVTVTASAQSASGGGSGSGSHGGGGAVDIETLLALAAVLARRTFARGRARKRTQAEQACGHFRRARTAFPAA